MYTFAIRLSTKYLFGKQWDNMNKWHFAWDFGVKQTFKSKKTALARAKQVLTNIKRLELKYEIYVEGQYKVYKIVEV